MAQLYLKGVYYDTESQGLWFLNNSGTYEEISTGGSSYLVYTALFTQSGTSNPIVTELENTLGGSVVWVRDGFGTYRGTLAGAFTLGKTISLPFGDFTTSNTSFIRIGGGNGGGLFNGWYTIYPETINSVVLNSVFVDDFSNIDLSSLIGSGSIYIEIRVYP